MEVLFSKQHGISVIQLSGDIDSTTAPAAQEKIFKLIPQGSPLVLDLSECRYISSAGLRVLLTIGKQLKAQNGTWALAGLSQEIIDIMEMTGFSSFFTICSSVKQAAVMVTRI